MNKNDAELEQLLRHWYRPFADVSVPESLDRRVDAIPDRIRAPRPWAVLDGSRRLMAIAAVLMLSTLVVAGVLVGGGPAPDGLFDPSPSGQTATDATATDLLTPVPPTHGLVNGRIAFSSNGQILVMAADGSNPLVLIESTTGAIYPTWSPDGTKLAYWLCEVNCGGDGVVEYTLILMDADGSNPRRLVERIGWPVATSWSPDGTRIAYAAAYGEIGELFGIFIVGLDGSPPYELAKDFDVGWSPDGTQLAYGDGRISVTDPAAGPGTSIFDEARNGTRATAGRVGDWSSSGSYHSWSPDGSQIAFRRRDNIFEFRNSIATTWVIDRDGSNAKELLGEGLVFGGWSPDGTRILYTRGGTEGTLIGIDEPFELTIANVDGTGSRSIPAADGTWAWSPDGRLLLGIGFSAQGEPAGITILDPSGATQPVTVDGQVSFGVSWQTIN